VTLADMHTRYGQAPEGVTCQTCVYLVRRSRNTGRGWLTCVKAQATDWRAKWRACGAHREE
jgi:hypothetical protein